MPSNLWWSPIASLIPPLSPNWPFDSLPVPGHWFVVILFLHNSFIGIYFTYHMIHPARMYMSVVQLNDICSCAATTPNYLMLMSQKKAWYLLLTTLQVPTPSISASDHLLQNRLLQKFQVNRGTYFMCTSCFSWDYNKIPDKDDLKKEGFVWAHCLTCWRRRGGRDVRQMLTLQLQSGSREGQTLVLSFLYCLGPQLMGWCHLHLVWVFPLQWTLSTNFLTDIHRDLSPRWF